MKLQFFKYQGTGNDFVIIDNRHHIFGKYDAKQISVLCDRKFGIGADGLILLEEDDKSDFKMVYFNSDGNQSSMCGNGGRCIVAFAKYLGIIDSETKFMAIDGLHHAKIDGDDYHLQMSDVFDVENHQTHCFLNTGSPHHVEMVNNLKSIDVKSKGYSIRYGKPYGEIGANVNFVEQLSSNKFEVRTYERGVENETLSCGTGVTAVAIAMHSTARTNENVINLKTMGGDLMVSFSFKEDAYRDIWLIGPAVQVFKGELTWKGKDLN